MSFFIRDEIIDHFYVFLFTLRIAFRLRSCDFAYLFGNRKMGNDSL